VSLNEKVKIFPRPIKLTQTSEILFNRIANRRTSISLLLLHVYNKLNVKKCYFPSTSVQWTRSVVVGDLRSIGYCVTEGVKFGGEFVTYPGDPAIFHGQFVIRIWCSDQCIILCFLVAQTRASYGARKHLILVSMKLNKRQNTKNLDYKTESRTWIYKYHDANFINQTYETLKHKRLYIGDFVVIIAYITMSPDAGFGFGTSDL